MTKVFIASRVGAKTKKQFEKNQCRMSAFARFALFKLKKELGGEEVDVEATGIYYCQFLNDFEEKERELGMALGRKRIGGCTRIFVLENEDGSISSGMERDTKTAYHEYGLEPEWYTPNFVENWLKENDPYGYELWQKSK